MEHYPQVLLNIRVQERRDVTVLPLVASAIADVESTLGDQGRVLVRASGTEPLIRVMVEGQNEQEVQAHAESIASAVRDSEPDAG